MTIPTHPIAGLAATLFSVALVAGSAQAQNTGARLTEVQGIVLVSQSDAIVAALGGERLPMGSRVVTTAGASATINDDAGCDVQLSENQRYTVRTGPCAVLLAQVQAQGPAPGAIVHNPVHLAKSLIGSRAWSV